LSEAKERVIEAAERLTEVGKWPIADAGLYLGRLVTLGQALDRLAATPQATAEGKEIK
jgi:hypothetical protein